jgi:hypothetical protein
MEEIKERIIKLLNVTTDRGATENEAMIAMSMATRLMIAHGIKQDELQQSEFVVEQSETTEVDYDWQEILAGAAGRLMGCTVLVTRGGGRKGFYYIGRRENHKAATDLWVFLVQQVERLYKVSMVPGMTQSMRANFRRTFKYACAVRVHNRATALIEEMKRGETPVFEGSTAVVVQNHFDKMKDEADEFLKKTGVQVGKARKRKAHRSGIGTAAGLMAGNSVQLRGVLR